ncbi:MAG: STAS domain-containing protein, partial [Atopobiaceae bacterium]|nr:STAS domain-containing protein [Atopobiaceae bacterium]
MSRVLTIDVSQDGKKYVLTLTGRVDANTAPQLEAAASRIYSENSTADIVMDMKDCSFLSSAGLRVIISMQKHAVTGGSLLFRDVAPRVM